MRLLFVQLLHQIKQSPTIMLSLSSFDFIFMCFKFNDRIIIKFTGKKKSGLFAANYFLRFGVLKFDYLFRFPKKVNFGQNDDFQ
jgi:hypothetical protein